MSLILDAGEVAFTSGGTRRWSSNDKNLMLLATVSTSFAINAVDRSDTTGLILDTEETLATIPANSTFILGHTVLSGRKRSIGGDQIVLIATELMQNAAVYYGSTGTGVQTVASMIWFNIFISGTALKVRVSYRFPSAARNKYPGATVLVCAMIGGFEY